jgi:APA family basic amino acid/polyamine antiporter
MNDGPRRLGQGAATALVVANMVGTGVFTTSGILMKILGSPWLVLLTWLLGGIVALLGALC